MKEDDIVVSPHIKEFGAWEEVNVEIALKVMDFYPDAIFIGEVNLETNVPNNPILYRCWIQYWDVHHHDGRHGQGGHGRGHNGG